MNSDGVTYLDSESFIRGGNIVKYLLCRDEELSLTPAPGTKRLGLGAYTRNPTIGSAETEGFSELAGQLA